MTIAQRALEAVTPSTAVNVGPSVSVAGRPAYALNIEPRTTATLVGRVEIDIDAAQRLPLRVAVYARGRSTAPLSASFTQVSFARIDPATFRFTPPPGAKVRRLGPFAEGMGAVGGSYASGSASASSGGGYGSSSATMPALATTQAPLKVTHPLESDQFGPRVFGSGWESVVAIRTPAISQLRVPARFLPFSGPLFSIRLVDRGDHGWLIYGLVPQSALVAVENRLH